MEAIWGIYQQMVAAYREPDRKLARFAMGHMVDFLRTEVPSGLTEIRKLGCALAKLRDDILAFFDRPGTSNEPTEAINGRLEHLRGSARGSRNLTNDIARSLLESSGFKPHLNLQMR